MVSRLLIALIVIRNSAFVVTGMYEILIHEGTKSMVSRPLILIVIKNSAFFVTGMSEIEDMKTQKVWCQNF